jgi:AAA+ ATPase superfamily predicted ATPase
MPKLVTGNIVSGDDFYDREKTIEQIWSRLETDSLIFSAPRRFGKSSIAQQLIDDPRNGFTAVMTDA